MSCRGIIILAVTAASSFSSGSEAAKTYNASHSNTVISSLCPKGQLLDTVTRKCVWPSSINYNASKSNTGNVVVSQCPVGQTWVAKVKHCELPGHVTY